MANQINLSAQQIATLNEITANGTANFVRGYEYVLGFIRDNPNVDSYTKFFFEGARQVNGNFSTDANIFIRGVTETGLAWDGKLASDPVARAAQIQATSDDIARNIFLQINKDGGIPQINDIIKNDASLAVSDHGQTVGGWAGAFYYWDARFTQPNGDNSLTVGQAILADPVQLEKFIAINAQALVDTSIRQGPSPNQIMTAWNGQAPANIKAEILSRAMDVLAGQELSFAGNPYNIDGYRPVIGGDERPIDWRLGGNIITDPAKINELNARYDIRLQKSEELSWQQLQRQGQIENPDGSKIIKFAGTGDQGDVTSKVNVDANSRVDGVETAKDDGTSTHTVFDTGTEPWSSETSAFDAYQRLQSQRVVFDGGSQQVKQYDPNNTHPYDQLDIDTDATGKVTAAKPKIDGQPGNNVDFSAVGQVLGSALGRALAPNNQFGQIAIGTVAGAIGQKLAQAFSASLLTDAAGVNFGSAFANFDISLAGAGAGSVASFLTAELGHALGLSGFQEQLFNASIGSVASGVANKIATEMLYNHLSFEAAIGAIDFGAAAVNAGYSISSLIGSYLGHELVPAQTHEGAVGGQLLGAVGSAIGISAAISLGLGTVLNFIVPGLGSLLGTIVGTLIGDAIGSHPHPAAVDLIDQAGYLYGYNHSAVSASDGGDYDAPDKMAVATDAIINAYLTAAKGAALDHSKQTMVGYVTDPDFRYINGWVPSHTYLNFISPDDAVHAAALDVLQHLEVIGGDLLLKRAHQNSSSNIPDPAPEWSGLTAASSQSGAEKLATLSGDLSVAQDYENYLNNREAINAVIATYPDSAFTAGWIATFARVSDLGLNHTNASDFLGGLVGFLDSVSKAGLGAIAANASVKHGSGSSIIVEVKVANGAEVPGSLSVFADQVSQTSDATGTTVQFTFGNGLGGNTLWFGGDVTNYLDAGASANAILVGGASYDVLTGGKGWDFLDGGAHIDALYGGEGNDILRGGTGSDALFGGAGNDTYVFNRGDGTDTVLDDATTTTSGWVDEWRDDDGDGTSEFHHDWVTTTTHSDGGKDSLLFGPGIAVSDVAVQLVQRSDGGQNLIVGVRDAAHRRAPVDQLADQITIQNWHDPKDRIESFVFADGTTLNVGAALADYQAPFGATLTGRTVAENSAVGSVVGTVAGFDLADGASYWLLDSAGGRFAINDPWSGVVTVANSALLDYEAASSHVITVRTADLVGHTFDKSFTIGVTDVYEAPTGAVLSSSEVAENAASGTVVGTFTGLDPDPHAILSYALTDSAGGRFSVHASSGVLSVANGALLNYEVAQGHVITLRTSDQSGHTLDKNFTIGVADVYEAPTGAVLSNSSVAENAANGTVVGTFTGFDPDPTAILSYALTDSAGGRFAVNASSGVLSVAGGALLNYEAAQGHVITLRTSDQSGHAFDKNFTIGVDDVYEAPSGVVLSNSSVAENAANGTVVGTATGIDSDPHAQLSYILTLDAGGRFAIDPSSGVITVANGALLDYEAAASHPIIVRARDQQGLFLDQPFTIDVTDVFEGVRSVTLSSSRVAEDSLNGTVVGTATGLDTDPSSQLSYILTLDAGGRFAINPSSGVITVANGALLDYEAATSHSIIVRARDQQGYFLDQPFTVALTDVPEITGGSGNDHLTGTALAELIDGGPGNDILTGGAGNDRFVFRPGSGADIISDFGAGAGSDDSLDLSAFAGTYTLADVLARTTQHGPDTVIDFGGGNSVTLQNVARTSLSGSDFMGMQAFSYGGRWSPAGNGIDNTWYVGDFNGDGRDDTFRYLNGEQVFLSTGGSFVEPGLWSPAGSGSDGTWHVGDFNGDGKADMFRFIDGIGNQTFLSSGSSFVYNGVWTPAGAGFDGTWHVGDFNGDGKADVFRYLNGEDVFLSNGSGFVESGLWSPAGSGSDGKWYIGDFNGDGKDDIFRFIEGIGAQMFLSTGSSFVYNGVWTGASTGTDGTFHVGDFNGDGKADLFRYMEGSAASSDVFLSNGSGFVYDTVWTGASIGLDHQWYVGDFNGNGADDIFRSLNGLDVFPGAFKGQTGLTISNASVMEHSPSHTVVGTVSGSDPHPDAVLSYALTDDAGGLFQFEPNSNVLVTAGGWSSLNAASAASHTVSVRATDQHGLFFSTSLTIAVTPDNVTLQTSTGSNTIIYDAPNVYFWRLFETDADAQGNPTSQFGINDGGGSWQNEYDVAGSQSWVTRMTVTNAANQLVSRTTNNDNGTHTLVANDVGNSFGWATFTMQFDADWNFTSVGGTNDNGSHALDMAEIWTSFESLLWYATPYVVTRMSLGDGQGDGMPVVLDLDGNGIDIVQLGASSASFNMDGNAGREHTAWAGNNDGFLALDLAADGKSGPDGVIEQTREIVFTAWAPGASTDMAALREVFDTDHNRLLDSGDARWNEFRIWQDANGDGVSQPGEVRTLDALGISSVGLDPAGPSKSFSDGSTIQGLASFTRTDGSTGLAGDVSLAYQREAVESGRDTMPIWQIGGGQLFGAIQSDWHIS